MASMEGELWVWGRSPQRDPKAPGHEVREGAKPSEFENILSFTVVNGMQICPFCYPVNCSNMFLKGYCIAFLFGVFCFQCFNTVGWASGMASRL